MSLQKSTKLRLVAKTVARQLRHDQTPAENILWQAIRNRKLGRKFLRQHPLLVDDDGRETFYVPDFYCAEAGLVVEVDGAVHDFTRERDAGRTKVLEARGLKVIRVRSWEVENGVEDVLERISREL